MTPKGIFTMLYYLICKKTMKCRHFETNTCDSIWHYWMCCYVVQGPTRCLFTKAYFGVRYIDLEHNHHAWIDFIDEYEFLVKISTRLVWLWPSPDSFIDVFSLPLSHFSSHIDLIVYFRQAVICHNTNSIRALLPAVALFSYFAWY